MSRKDYVAIANMLMRLRHLGYDPTTLDRVIEGMSDILMADNSRFDPTRFQRVSGHML